MSSTSTSSTPDASPTAPTDHAPQRPFNFALTLEPMSTDDAANLRAVALLLAAALAVIALLVALARHSARLRP